MRGPLIDSGPFAFQAEAIRDIMNAMARLFLFTFLLCAPALPVSAGPALRLGAGVVELTRGLICAPPEAGRRDAPDTASGWIHVPDQPIEIRVESTIVPALLGTGFGVRYMLEATPQLPIPVRYIVIHPPLPPDGLTRQSWESLVMPGMPEQVFFQFDIADELQPGQWSFTAESGATELFHAAFDVVPPETVPHLTALCRGGDLLAFSRIPPAAPD